ncbi:hypothetical protein Tco_1507956 [Tanacetum coccineum]
MSTLNNSTNSNQQTLVDLGANERPPMLEKGNYIPWESRFRRFLDNKLEDEDRMWNSIQNGPYQRPMVVDPTNPTVQILELLVDHGMKITTHVRHSRLMDKFDKFATKEGESLDFVHERLTILVNIMDRNNVRPIPVAINTKFLNFLQPEWSKYVTMGETKNAGRNRTQGFNTGNAGHYARERQKPKVHDAKYFREQMLLAIKDEAGSNLGNEENDFMLDTSYGENLEELNAAVIWVGLYNPERLKKAITAQPKMYDGDLIHNNKLVIHSTDLEETLEDAEEIRNKMRHKMVQINYEKLNALYETFVPQQELFVEQTYFSITFKSDNDSNSKDFSIGITREIRDCVLLSVEQQKHELLKVELEKTLSDSRDIQANLLKRIKIIKNDFQRSQAQSIAFELKLQHQKEKMACDVSWKAKLSTLHDENVLLKHQVEPTVKERENIKLEFQRFFNSVKATRVQHQNEINELVEKGSQKTYYYADVRAQNQDLLMTISELKSKLRMIDKGKHVNTKFDKSETLGQLLCVTPFNKNLAIKAKNVSNTKVTSDRPNPVTS